MEYQYTELTLSGNIPTIEDKEKAFFLKGEIAKVKAQIKRMEDELDKEILEYLDRENIKSIELDDVVICKTKKKTNRYDTQAIYKALNFTKEQIAVLPENPSWKKTAILDNEKTAAAFYEDEKDIVELKQINKKFIK